MNNHDDHDGINLLIFRSAVHSKILKHVIIIIKFLQLYD